MFTLPITIVLTVIIASITLISFKKVDAICKHKWGDPREGHQFCLHCNESKTMTAPACVHHWKIIESFQISHGDTKTGQQKILQCAECGDIKQEILSVR